MDVLNVGDMVMVKVIGVDRDGKSRTGTPGSRSVPVLSGAGEGVMVAAAPDKDVLPPHRRGPDARPERRFSSECERES